jgi:subtilase family serine protease
MGMKALTHVITTLALCGSVAAPALFTSAFAQQSRAPLIVQPVNETARSRLIGNVSARITVEEDVGPTPGTLQMDELAFVLKRSPAQELALAELLSAQQNHNSAQYHRWLTPEQFGSRFGATDSDTRTLSAWLRAHGFVVKPIVHGRDLLQFSGTEAQVQAAFRTPIHFFSSNGERHWANVTDPEIPSAFAPAIVGILGLNDFHPRPQHHRVVPAESATSPLGPQFNTGGAYGYAVGPTDFSTIYNLQPLRNKGITGSGATIAIVAQSSINTSTPPAYWSAFGVTQGQTISIVVPSGATDPGETGDSNEMEADLDVEVAGGVAQNAALILIPSSSALISAEYAIDNNLAPIVSISFGECELNLTTAGNAAVAAMYQKAATLGITVVVASGDQGPAACDVGDDTGPAAAVGGTAVNGLASTPYNTAVGGTDFNFLGVTESQYWGATNVPSTFSDALSYMPEMPWNSSCADSVLLQYLPSYASVEAICNNPSNASAVVVLGGGGGVSNCTSPSGTSQGTCAGGYTQPSWQSGMIALPGSTARAIPDVSFFAATGFFGNSWVICSYANTTCNPNGSAQAADGYELIGGTSASTPAFAGILALLLQTQVSAQNPDGRQGLINPTLYQLATAEYGSVQAPNATGLNNCNSSKGNAVGGNCVFYDITTGSNAVPCSTGSVNCVTQTNGDSYGVLGSNGTVAFAAGPGFDLATGLGSLNVTNFVTTLWIPPAPTGLAATPGNGTIALSWSATNLAQTYNVYQGTAAGAEGAAPVLTGIGGTAVTISGLANGQAYFYRVAAVNGGGTSAFSNEADATVLPSTPTALVATAANGSVTLSWSPSKGATSYSVYQGTSAGGEGASAVRAGIVGAATTISGLSNGQVYFFEVAAVNGGGSSAHSNEASATPVAPSGGGGVGAIEVLFLSLLTVMSLRRRTRTLQPRLLEGTRIPLCRR